jgi:hypothetical protein
LPFVPAYAAWFDLPAIHPISYDDSINQWKGDGVDAELQAIRDMVTEANLPTNVRETILARFDQLPKLYRELSRTYETRFSDRIVGSIEGMARTLSAKDAGADGPLLAATLVKRLRSMHDQHGVAVALKPPATKPARKKKSA